MEFECLPREYLLLLVHDFDDFFFIFKVVRKGLMVYIVERLVAVKMVQSVTQSMDSVNVNLVTKATTANTVSDSFIATH